MRRGHPPALPLLLACGGLPLPLWKLLSPPPRLFPSGQRATAGAADHQPLIVVEMRRHSHSVPRRRRPGRGARSPTPPRTAHRCPRERAPSPAKGAAPRLSGRGDPPPPFFLTPPPPRRMSVPRPQSLRGRAPSELSFHRRHPSWKPPAKLGQACCRRPGGKAFLAPTSLDARGVHPLWPGTRRSRLLGSAPREPPPPSIPPLPRVSRAGCQSALLCGGGDHPTVGWRREGQPHSPAARRL